MLWTSKVSYFTVSSRTAAVHPIIILIILKELFDNQIVDCMEQTQDKRATTLDSNNICKNRIL